MGLIFQNYTMKLLILILFITGFSYSQDNITNSDGRVNNYSPDAIKLDLNGDGVPDNYFIPSQDKIVHLTQTNSPQNLTFSSFWTSPAGAFGNCWDGIAGYFDNDTLLDIAGYTFSPNMFYIWEQT